MEPSLTEKLNRMRIVLATEAKQRREIFEKMNIPFETVSAHYHPNTRSEKHYPLNIFKNEGECKAFLQLSAQHKAKTVYDNFTNPPDLIIGMDTKVLYENDSHEIECLSRPKTPDNAVQLLKKLTSSGPERLKTVITAVAIIYNGKTKTFNESTTVCFRPLSDEEIFAYVGTGEPLEKAGGFAIQGLAATFVEKIVGDYYNVMGLPLCRLIVELKAMILQ